VRPEKKMFYWKRFNLTNDEDKIKLLEVLLVVGSILVALKFLTDSIVFLFLLFVVVAIVLYIKLKKGTPKTKHHNVTVLMASATFSGTLAVELGLSFVAAFNTSTILSNILNTGILATILAFIYYSVITFFLYGALKD
jgi:hypothetical protein